MATEPYPLESNPLESNPIDTNPAEATPAPEAPAPTLAERLQSAQSATLEQLEASWSMRVSRAEELLREGVATQIAAILESNLEAIQQHVAAELETQYHRLAQEHAAQLQSASEAAAAAEAVAAAAVAEAAAATEATAASVAAATAAATAQTSTALTAKLNETARRLRAATQQDEWASALYDAARPFAPRIAVFAIHGRFLHLDHAPFAAPLTDLPISEVPAIEAACDSGEPVVALYSEQELSAPIVASFGAASGPRAHIFPLVIADRTIAILYAEGSRTDCDPNALELLATLAASVWEARRRAPEPIRSGPQLITLQSAPPPSPVPDVPVAAWTELPPDDRDLHLRAQRFARVRVAEMRLYKSALVLEGRRTHSLYQLLQHEIDQARQEFQAQFHERCESMIDYFHGELVKTLANDDETLLGEGYPGPLT